MKAGVVLSIIVALICVVLFTTLLIQKHIGPLSYITLVTLLASVCLVIPVVRRLRELALGKLKMTLDKIEKLDKIERRIQETEKMKNVDKNFIEDLPEDTKGYDALVRAYKYEQNLVLKKAIEKDDISLKESTEKILTQIELQEKIIRELPQLHENFIKITRNLEGTKEDIKRFIAYMPTSFITSQKTGIEKSSLFTASNASRVGE